MGYDQWAVELTQEDDLEREFVLKLRDSNLAPESSRWQWMSSAMSEGKIRQELSKINVPREKQDADITKARATKIYRTIA
jgi:hypothetical protein